MKKYLLYFLALIVISSCDNLKKKDKTSEDDTEETGKKIKKPLDDDDEIADDEKPKKKKPVEEDLPVDDEEKKNDDEPLVVTVDENMNAEQRWTSADRKKFMDECIGTAEKNLGEKRANEYCSCFLGKIEKKYISYRAANAMTQAELKDWAAECNGQK